MLCRNFLFEFLRMKTFSDRKTVMIDCVVYLPGLWIVLNIWVDYSVHCTLTVLVDLNE